MTLQTIGNGYKSQIRQLAGSKNDVSGMAGLYYQYMDAVNTLRADIGMPPIKEEKSIQEKEQTMQALKEKLG